MGRPLNCFRTAALLGAVLSLAACSPDKPVPVPRTITDKTPCGTLTYAGFPKLDPEIKAPFFVCKKDTFALEFNPTSKTPLWATEHLMGATLSAGTAPYAEDFRPDPDVPEAVRSQMYDYAMQGYDRGQMAPAEDYGQDLVKISRSFYLTNTVPQNPDNNRGIWSVLERNVRDWAIAKGELYVITGPIYPRGQTAAWIGGPPKRQGGAVQHRYSTPDLKNPYKGKMGVPVYLYKVILDPKTHQAVAFIIPNQSVPASELPRYATSVAMVEQYTRLTFFPDLTPAQHQQVVNTVLPSAWVLH